MPYFNKLVGAFIIGRRGALLFIILNLYNRGEGRDPAKLN